MNDIMIKYPIKFEERGGYFFDGGGNMIAQVRGWGRISYMKNPHFKQDEVGRFIAAAINEKLKQSDFVLE